jgi:hypothetical protein
MKIKPSTLSVDLKSKCLSFFRRILQTYFPETTIEVR